MFVARKQYDSGAERSSNVDVKTSASLSSGSIQASSFGACNLTPDSEVGRNSSTVCDERSAALVNAECGATGYECLRWGFISHVGQINNYPSARYLIDNILGSRLDASWVTFKCITNKVYFLLLIH